MSHLKTKSLTTIPFARESYNILLQLHSNEFKGVINISQEYFRVLQFKLNELPIEVLLRLMHFEKRYLSIDKGVKELGNNNILEFASGFSFRGFNFCKNPDIHFIDTDLQMLLRNLRIYIVLKMKEKEVKN